MLLSKIIGFVITTTAKYSIDESHGLSHSLNALFYANKIFEREIIKKPYIKPQERLIYISAAIHDMCDKKYMDEKTGIKNICEYLTTIKSPQLHTYEIDAVSKIISTMSYSTVKKNGFPNLQEFQSAYHIVRESDLLCAYDFDRSMIYHMSVKNETIYNAYDNARDLFMTRVLKHNDDKLFFTDFAREESLILHEDAIQRMNHWGHILSNKCTENALSRFSRY